MSEEIKKIELPKLPVLKSESVEKWDDVTSRAEMYLSQFTVIETEEDFNKVKEGLKGARKAYQVISKERKEFTSQLSAAAKSLMQFEKRIDTSPGSGSQYDRVLKLQQDYATKLAEISRRKEAKALLTKNKNTEIANITDDFPVTIARKLNDVMTAMDGKFTKWANELKLNEFDEKVDLFKKYIHKLEDHTYRSFFDFEAQYLTIDERDALVVTLKENHPFEEVEAEYLRLFRLAKEEYYKLLPWIRKNLVEMDELKKKDAEAAAQKELENKKALEDSQKKAAEERESKLDEIKAAQELENNAKMLDIQFEEQEVLQKEKPKGQREISYGKIVAPANKQPALISKIVHHCFLSPEFKGIFTKKDGEDPELIPAVEWWVKFFVKHCSDQTLDGLKIEKKISIINR